MLFATAQEGAFNMEREVQGRTYMIAEVWLHPPPHTHTHTHTLGCVPYGNVCLWTGSGGVANLSGVVLVRESESGRCENTP